MREIKFRAWDKINHRMRQVCDLFIRDEGIAGWCETWSFRPEDVELMQFTGLHDKNGKEIYEEDIVRTKGTTLAGESWERTKVIEFNSHYGYGLMCSELLSEIIGNIYENPELKEGK
jgi:uncharacterized phage protein (TIGR01671 family)